MTAPVTVTQIDREAAARAGLDMARLNERDADALRQGGGWDEWDLVQAFARHRQQAEAASAAQVAELREALENAAEWFDDYARGHSEQAASILDPASRRERERKANRNAYRAAELRDAIARAKANPDA